MPFINQWKGQTIIEVHTYKYGGIPHYSYPVEPIVKTADYWMCRGVIGGTLVHHTRGLTFPINHLSVEFYWPGRPYTVHATVSDGQVEKYYCNIILPPTITEDRAEWVDLDLDVIVQPDLTWEVIDEEDFQVNSVRYGYPPEVIAGARQAVTELIHLIETRQFPFDGGWSCR